MPLANRVTPFGDIVADPARGLLMGNRGGRIHDPETRTLSRRRWASKAWICCRLAFKGRHRRVWSRSYTELFFCDEVTALAAGHRPCFECRRADALAYRDAAARSLKLAALPSFPDLDRQLHRGRLEGRGQRRALFPAESLPDGAMVAIQAQAFALRGGRMLAWTPAGYAASRPIPKGRVAVLTPALTLAALQAGFSPLWHPSAHDAQAAS